MSSTRKARRIDLLRRSHLAVGLFAFTALVVFAVAGIEASLPRRTAAGSGAAEVEERPFRTPGELDDGQLAALVHSTLRLPMTRVVPAWARRRDAEQRLVLDFHSVNGLRRVTVLEDEGKLRIEHYRAPLLEFLNRMHATTLSDSAADLRLRLWAAYVDLSIFSLLLLAVTGVWLWLETRPRLVWAWMALAGGGALFAALWALLR